METHGDRLRRGSVRRDVRHPLIKLKGVNPTSLAINGKGSFFLIPRNRGTPGT